MCWHLLDEAVELGVAELAGRLERVEDLPLLAAVLSPAQHGSVF